MKSMIEQFQSTLPRGERRFFYCRFLGGADFNPRSHEGSDHERQLNYCSVPISIHAPTRGATFCPLLHHAYRMKFQSTLPRGERPPERMEIIQQMHFNPRSHEGSDCICSSTGCAEYYFNPRSHEGSDLSVHRCSILRIISIHAPTRGATATH